MSRQVNPNNLLQRPNNPRSPQPDMRASPNLRRRRSSCVAKPTPEECPLLSMATTGLSKIDKAIEARNHSQLSSILQNSIMHYVEQGDEESLVSLLNKLSCMLIAGAECAAGSAKAKPSFEDLSKARTAPGVQENVYASLRRKSVDLASTLPQLAQPTPHEEECEDEEQVSSRVVKRVEQAMSAMRAGDVVVIVSEEENDKEGVLAIAAEMATSEKIAFMVNETCGIIGVATTARRLDELGLPRVDVLDTKSDSVDLARHKFEKEKHSGKSAAARAATIRAFTDPDTSKADFVRPGNVFPLRAKIKGVLDRRETEEAAMDLARMAGLYPAAAMAELVNKDGNMMQPADCHHFAAQHGLVYLTVGDVVAYRHLKEGAHDAWYAAHAQPMETLSSSSSSSSSSKSSSGGNGSGYGSGNNSSSGGSSGSGGNGPSSAFNEAKTERVADADSKKEKERDNRSKETQTEKETERESHTKFEANLPSGMTSQTTISAEILKEKPKSGEGWNEMENDLDQYARSSEELGCDSLKETRSSDQPQGVPETRTWEWSSLKKSRDGRVLLDQHRVQDSLVHVTTTSASSQTSPSYSSSSLARVDAYAQTDSDSSKVQEAQGQGHAQSQLQKRDEGQGQGQGQGQEASDMSSKLYARM